MKAVEQPSHVLSRRPRARRGERAPELGATDLKLSSLWKGLRAESMALWALCAFVFFEYIRPQQMYPIIDVLPWGLITIVVASVAAMMSRGPSHGLNALDVLGGVLLLIVVASMALAYDPALAFGEWKAVGTIVLMYFCLRAALNTPNRLLLFTIVFLILNLKFSQYSARSFATRGFSFAGFGVAGSGWFTNSGELSMQMGVFFFMSLCVLLALRPFVKNQRRWWVLMALLPGTALLTVIASSSRGGQLALAVAATLMLVKPPDFLRKLGGFAVLVVLVAIFLPQEQIDRFRTAGEDDTSQSRLAYFEIGKQIFSENPAGIGLNNWRRYYGDFYWDPEIFRRIEVSHNSYLDAFVELGLQGGIVFLLMLVAAMLMNLQTQAKLKNRTDAGSLATRGIARGINLGLLSTCIASYFMSVLYYPVFWLAFGLTSAAFQVSRSLVDGKSSTAAPGKTRRRVPNARALRPAAAAALDRAEAPWSVQGP
jgi:O-antigen ligase